MALYKSCIIITIIIIIINMIRWRNNTQIVLVAHNLACDFSSFIII